MVVLLLFSFSFGGWKKKEQILAQSEEGGDVQHGPTNVRRKGGSINEAEEEGGGLGGNKGL